MSFILLITLFILVSGLFSVTDVNPEVIESHAPVFTMLLTTFVQQLLLCFLIIIIQLFLFGFLFVSNLGNDVVRESFSPSFLLGIVIFSVLFFLYQINIFFWLADVWLSILGIEVHDISNFNMSEVFLTGHFSIFLLYMWCCVFFLVMFVLYFSYFGYRGLLAYFGNKVLPINITLFFIITLFVLGNGYYFFDWIREMSWSLWLYGNPAVMDVINPTTPFIFHESPHFTYLSTNAGVFLNYLYSFLHNIFSWSVLFNFLVLLVMLLLYVSNLVNVNRWFVIFFFVILFGYCIILLL